MWSTPPTCPVSSTSRRVAFSFWETTGPDPTTPGGGAIPTYLPTRFRGRPVSPSGPSPTSDPCINRTPYNKRDCRTMCDSLQICLVGAVSTNILTPYDVKTAFAGKSGKYCVKFLRNLQIKGGKRLLLFVGCCKIPILQHPIP